MRLGTFYDGLEVHRRDKVLYGRFLSPHRVASTCQVAGGVREDLEIVYNHQICEPAGHRPSAGSGAPRDLRAEHLAFCASSDLPGEASAGLGTAANMRCAGLAQRQFRDLVVVAACTAGVEGNAGRAGDPASWFEHEGRFEQVSPVPQPGGTINTLLFVSHELTPGTLIRSLITATEVKTATLQDLLVGSRYSPGQATGTGTDQIAAACRLGTGRPLTSAGLHSILGQLIGETVSEAIGQALILQNGLTPQRQRSVVTQLGRFGVNEQACRLRARQLLPVGEAELFNANFAVIDTDPMVVAAASALAELADQLRTGVLPASCAREIFHGYGANLVRAVSGAIPDHHSCDWVSRSLADVEVASDARPADLAWLVPTALALGFGQKWRSPI
jgi:adenosylcobinamide amidohydrolase